MKGKKLLAGVLSAAMVLGTMSFPVFAENTDNSLIEVSDSDTLKAAVNSIAENGTIKFTNEITVTKDGGYDPGVITFTKNCTVDLNGQTLNTGEMQWFAGSAAVTFTSGAANGTIKFGDVADSLFRPNENGSFSIENITFTQTENAEVCYLFQMAGENSSINLKNCVLENINTANYGGVICGNNRENTKASIENCQITNINGVAVFGGQVTVKDSTISATTPFKIARDNHYAVLSGETTITGDNNEHNGNKIYTIGEDVTVDSRIPTTVPAATIGTTPYATLADAVAAAQDGDVIDLIGNTVQLDGQTTIDKDVTITNGTFNITGANCTTEGIIYIDNKTVEFNNVDFVGSNFTSAFGVIFANHNADVTLYNCDFTLKNDLAPSGGTLKGNDNASFTVKNCKFDLENPSRVLTNITLDMSDTTINAYVTDPARAAGDLNNHAFRNMVGSVENSTIAADGFETGIKNDTGALIVDNSTITLKNSYNGANLVISGEARLSLKTGYYSFNPINYLADGYSVLESDKTGFFKVGETPAVPETVPETKVDVKDPTVIVPVDSGITEEALKTAVKSVATQESLQSATAVAVQKDETLVGTVDNAKEELERENIAVDNETVTVIVKPYLEVKVLTVEAGSITLNIVPKCDVIATTAEENEAVNTEGTEKNAVVLEEGKTLEVVTPMTITIALPADFASVGDTIYINHVKDDGSTYIYDAVVGGTTGALTATFTNPNGFSTFTATTASEAVVKIGDIGYKTLEEAVGKVKADETIVLLDDNAEEVTVARDISFILDKDSNEFTGSISAGDNTTVTTSDDGEKTTYSFDYTAPSIPVGSGGTGAVSFIVDFRTNGGSIVSSVKVKKGEKVIRPEDPTKEGYTFGGWFTDEALKKEYDFDTKVQKKLVLYAKWIEEAAVEPEPELPVFTDVKETDWFYESVMTAFKKGLMNGVSETEFAPDTTLTRAMLVTILYRAEGEPATNRSIPFADIEMGSYYANAVIWAAQNGIVNGTTETTFAPDSNITREQVAAILYRYAIYKGMDAVDLSENLNFADSDDVSEYAISALNWATGCGLVTGYEDNTLRPLANTTRAEAATLLQRFIETDK